MNNSKSYDGKKERAWQWYEDNAETVWRIMTYKKGGARAKLDEYPLGTCHGCGEGKRLKWTDKLSEMWGRTWLEYDSTKEKNER